MNDSSNEAHVFPPPAKPVECFCLHCGRIYTSNLILPVEIDGETHYACPVEGCTAMGWEFDIFPVNEEDEASVHWEECDEDDEDTEWIDDTRDPNEESFDPASTSFEPPRDWTPEADLEEEEDESGYEPEEPVYFTQEDFDRLKASGEIDRRLEQIRTQWMEIAKDRAEFEKSLPFGDEQSFKDEDIPF